MWRLPGGVFPLLGICSVFLGTALILPLEYHVINVPMTWHEAQSYCRVKYTDLATVDDQSSHDSLLSAVNGQVSYSWIGLWRGPTSRWMWSDGSGAVKLTKWSDYGANSLSGDGWCAELAKDGSWDYVSCGKLQGFVCYERRDDGMERFVYYSRKETWMRSQDTCRHTHGDLATVRSDVDNDEIVELISPSSDSHSRRVWIGLFHDSWLWSDGAESSFRRWRVDGTPTGHCAVVEIQLDALWAARPCDHKHPFVCQGELKLKRTVIGMVLHTSTNLSVTIHDELLEEVGTKLRVGYVTDFQVFWHRNEEGSVFAPHEPLEDMV